MSIPASLKELPAYAKLLGIKLVKVSPEGVEAEIEVREDFKNNSGVMHGGAIMGYADHVGGAASHVHLKPGQRTTTLESKTNFFGGIPIGGVARAVATPLHIGRSTIVVQTKIMRPDGKLAAIVTQTQMVLEGKG
jgi:1,4-dihydroxy-2-naphthoyl-CoA hydrolase